MWKVLVQHAQNLAYLDREGSWTLARESAHDFGRIQLARNHCQEVNLRDVRIILYSEDAARRRDNSPATIVVKLPVSSRLE
jgi:hypothetical protein